MNTAETIYRPTWHIWVRDANGAELVHKRPYQPGNGEAAVASVEQWYTTRVDALPVKVLSIDMVAEYHPTASILDGRWDVELEGGEERDTDLYVHIGEHSIKVPAEHVEAVMSALAAEVLKKAEAIAAWPALEPDDWGDTR